MFSGDSKICIPSVPQPAHTFSPFCLSVYGAAYEFLWSQLEDYKHFLFPSFNKNRNCGYFCTFSCCYVCFQEEIRKYSELNYCCFPAGKPTENVLLCHQAYPQHLQLQRQMYTWKPTYHTPKSLRVINQANKTIKWDIFYFSFLTNTSSQ